MREAERHYIVICDYTVDGEHGVDIIGVRHSMEEAKDLFRKQIPIEEKNAETNGYDSVEVGDTSWSSFEDGHHGDNHIDLYIQEVKE